MNMNNFFKTIIHPKNSYFVTDEVWAGCQKLGHTTLMCLLLRLCKLFEFESELEDCDPEYTFNDEENNLV